MYSIKKVLITGAATFLTRHHTQVIHQQFLFQLNRYGMKNAKGIFQNQTSIDFFEEVSIISSRADTFSLVYFPDEETYSFAEYDVLKKFAQ